MALLLEAESDLTAFAAFPERHWTKIWSTNPLERFNREIKRRIDVVQVFPNDDALLRLVSAVLFELHDEWIAFPPPPPARRQHGPSLPRRTTRQRSCAPQHHLRVIDYTTKSGAVRVLPGTSGVFFVPYRDHVPLAVLLDDERPGFARRRRHQP